MKWGVKSKLKRSDRESGSRASMSMKESDKSHHYETTDLNPVESFRITKRIKLIPPKLTGDEAKSTTAELKLDKQYNVENVEPTDGVPDENSNKWLPLPRFMETEERLAIYPKPHSYNRCVMIRFDHLKGSPFN